MVQTQLVWRLYHNSSMFDSSLRCVVPFHTSAGFWFLRCRNLGCDHDLAVHRAQGAICSRVGWYKMTSSRAPCIEACSQRIHLFYRSAVTATGTHHSASSAEFGSAIDAVEMARVEKSAEFSFGQSTDSWVG